MTVTPLLTVFMPTFNGAKFIRESIDSVLATTIRDFELVVADDGSTDDTAACVQQIHHPAVRLIRNATNLGVAATYAQSVPLFRGKYLAFLDHDDIAAPGRFEQQIERLESAGGPDVLGGFMQCFGERQDRICPPQSNILIRTVLPFFCPIANPTVCMRMGPFRDGRLGFSLGAGPAADYDLWYQVAAAGLRMENLDRVVTHYRCHGTSLTRVSGGEVERGTEWVRRRVIGLYFPSLGMARRDALAVALSGREWANVAEAENGIGALAHAAAAVSDVPDIDPGVMTAMLEEVLVARIGTGLRSSIIDNAHLEAFTENDAYFEAWRAQAGGSLDRRIIDLVLQGGVAGSCVSS